MTLFHLVGFGALTIMVLNGVIVGYAPDPVVRPVVWFDSVVTLVTPLLWMLALISSTGAFSLLGVFGLSASVYLLVMRGGVAENARGIVGVQTR
jgi:hypothetical protein